MQKGDLGSHFLKQFSHLSLVATTKPVEFTPVNGYGSLALLLHSFLVIRVVMAVVFFAHKGSVVVFF